VYNSEEKSVDEYFINLVGLNKFENLGDILKNENIKYSTIYELIQNLNQLETKTIIFHNENDYLALNIILELEKLYNNGICGYTYINFDIIKNFNRNKIQEYIDYSLLSLFPKNYTFFETFFENNIKN